MLGTPRSSGPIVVTGASGFIGRALVRAIAARDVPVIAVTRREASSGDATWTRVVDYRQTPCPAGATLVHLAEEADISSASLRGQLHVEEVRDRIADLAGKSFRRIVYASSGQIYRARNGATDPYVAGKRAAEAIVTHAGGVVVRLANVYGPGMPQGMLISRIMRQIPGSGPLRIRSATPRRDFLWIDDAAEGLATIALGNGNGVFDLGTGRSFSAGEIARRALAVAGEGDRPVIAETESAEEDAVTLDVTAVRLQFGWRPKIDIDQGLAHLVKAAA